MERIVYPEFPLISNIEFFCLYLLEHGPMHKRDLLAAFWKWRKDETRFNYYELFGLYGGMCGPTPRLARQRLNFTVFVLPRRKGRNIMLAPLGFRTAAQALERIARLERLDVEERTFYCYFKKFGESHFVQLQEQDEVYTDQVYTIQHRVCTEPPSYKVIEVKAKTHLGAIRAAQHIECPFPGFIRHRISKVEYKLNSKRLDSRYDKCWCRKCRKERARKRKT